VIMSGGDPMMLSDRRLDTSPAVRAIPHIEIIRIGSRITSHSSGRITRNSRDGAEVPPDLHEHHFNHPSELTPSAWPTWIACREPEYRSAADGAAQGVNDDPKVNDEADALSAEGACRPTTYIGGPGGRRETIPHYRAEGSRDQRRCADGRRVWRFRSS